MLRTSFLLVILVPLLGGCGIATGGLSNVEKQQLTPAAKVYGLQGEFNILLSAVKSYTDLPRCSVSVVVSCSEGMVVQRARRLVITAKVVLDHAKATVKAFPGTHAALVAASSLRLAIAQLAAYLTSEKIGAEI